MGWIMDFWIRIRGCEGTWEEETLDDPVDEAGAFEGTPEEEDMVQYGMEYENNTTEKKL